MSVVNVNKSEPKRYAIRTVFDFLNVPIDRRAVCLLEFLQWLQVVEAAKLGGPEVSVLRDSYDWVDDGLGNMNLHINIHDKRDEHFVP